MFGVVGPYTVNYVKQKNTHAIVVNNYDYFTYLIELVKSYDEHFRERQH